MPIYMNIEGVPGDVTAEGHEKWIEVSSFQFGIGRHIGVPTGRHAEREASAPSISEITITKTSDMASPKLFQNAIHGEGLKIKFDFCKTDKDKLEVYDQIEIQDAMISNESISSGGERWMESISFNYTQITYNHVAMDDLNATGTPERVGYDLAKAKAI